MEKQKEVKKEKMKQEKKNLLLFLLAILITVIPMFYFIGQKEGWHEDEIFSYGSSNYRYDNLFQRFGVKDSLNRTIDEKIMEGNVFQNTFYYLTHSDQFLEEYNKNIQKESPVWKTSEDAKDYMTVSSDEIFNYWSVYYNQSRDVHPPLFYILVHTFSTFCLGNFSKYIIFVLSLLFYVASCFVIRKIFKLFQKEHLIPITILLYGLSMGAISSVIFQRMYMMLTFFAIAYLYISLKILKSNGTIEKKTKRQVFWVTVLGFWTQYYFCIYIIGIVAILLVYLWKNKKYQELKIYIVTHIKSAIVGIVLFPASIYHIFFSYRGIGGTAEQLPFLTRLDEFMKLLFYSFSIPDVIGYTLVGILAVIFIVKLFTAKRKDIVLVITLPVILFLLVITKITPFTNLRYIMCILPIIVIAIVFMIHTIMKKFYQLLEKRKPILKENKLFLVLKNNSAVIICTILTIMISTYGFRESRPMYLYTGYSEKIAIAEENKHTKFIYVGEVVFSHLQDMEEFLKYDNYLILSTQEIDVLKNNAGLKNETEYILDIKRWLPEQERLLQEVLNNTNGRVEEILQQDDQSTIYKIKIEK